MTKKDWLLLITLLGLITVYAVWFSDWFKPKTIVIATTSRMSPRMIFRRPGVVDRPAAIPPTFILGPHPFKLTELKVVLLSEWQTNHEVLPVWHLVSESNSTPILKFLYGQNRALPGLHPAVPGTFADPLVPDQSYRIFLTAGAYKGVHDFVPKAAN
jgi:hypothetical protein